MNLVYLAFVSILFLSIFDIGVNEISPIFELHTQEFQEMKITIGKKEIV